MRSECREKISSFGRRVEKKEKFVIHRNFAVGRSGFARSGANWNPDDGRVINFISDFRKEDILVLPKYSSVKIVFFCIIEEAGCECG